MFESWGFASIVDYFWPPVSDDLPLLFRQGGAPSSRKSRRTVAQDRRRAAKVRARKRAKRFGQAR